MIAEVTVSSMDYPHANVVCICLRYKQHDKNDVITCYASEMTKAKTEPVMSEAEQKEEKTTVNKGIYNRCR